MLQLGKICDKYGINLIYPQPLTYNSGWFAGFFDSDGSIYMNELSGQLFITVSQKNKFLLDALVELYGGTIYAPLPGLSSLPAGPQPTQPPGGGQWVVYLFLFLFLFFNKFKN